MTDSLPLVPEPDPFCVHPAGWCYSELGLWWYQFHYSHVLLSHSTMKVILLKTCN